MPFFLLPPAGAFCLPPAGNFLSVAKESTQRTPAETHGFCTSFVVCNSCFLNPAEAGNWSTSTHAAALLGVEEVFCSTVGSGLPRALRTLAMTRQDGHKLYWGAGGFLIRSFCHSEPGRRPGVGIRTFFEGFAYYLRRPTFPSSWKSGQKSRQKPMVSGLPFVCKSCRINPAEVGN